MQVSHLQSIVKLHIASMVVRIVVVGAAVFVGIATWQPGLGPELPPLHHVDRRHLLLAARAVRAWRARRSCRISRGRRRRSARRSRRPAFSTSISSPSSSARCWRSICCSRRACPCSTVKFAGCTAVRNLCNFSLRTASGPEGSSAKQILTCAAGPPGRGSVCNLTEIL